MVQFSKQCLVTKSFFTFNKLRLTLSEYRFTSSRSGVINDIIFLLGQLLHYIMTNGLVLCMHHGFASGYQL